jgi:hypothetical protein
VRGDESLETKVTPFIKALPAERVTKVEIDLTAYQSAAEELVAQAERAEITDAESYAKGGDLIKIARTQSNKAEDQRKELVGPYNKLVKWINGAFKVPKDRFTDARSIVETKMMKWKRAEDARLKKEAEEERKRLEAEALERAAAEKTEEAQDEVLDAAADAGEKVIDMAGVGLQRGNYGSSTGTKKRYNTEVVNLVLFVTFLVTGGLLKKVGVELASIVEFKKSGMNRLAELAFKAGVKDVPGAKFIESEDIRVY